MKENNIDYDTSEINKIFEKFEKQEQEGLRDILKYFDRIHDKLFTFNNILIAGYFALSRFSDTFSIYMIIIPLVNLGLLIYIEYRMMQKSRFESEITKKSKKQIDDYGKRIEKTNRYSLYSILSTAIVLGVFLYNLFLLDANAKSIEKKEKHSSRIKVKIVDVNAKFG